MTRLDDAILRGYTRLAHAWQRRTGRTSFWCSQQCAAFSAVMDVVILWLFSIGQPGFIATGALIWSYLAYRSAAADATFRTDPNFLPAITNYANRPFFKAARLILLVVNAFMTVAIALRLAWRFEASGVLVGACLVASVSYSYFVGVVPLPPARQRDRVRGTLIPHLSRS